MSNSIFIQAECTCAAACGGSHDVACDTRMGVWVVHVPTNQRARYGDTPPIVQRFDAYHALLALLDATGSGFRAGEINLVSSADFGETVVFQVGDPESQYTLKFEATRKVRHV